MIRIFRYLSNAFSLHHQDTDPIFGSSDSFLNVSTHRRLSSRVRVELTICASSSTTVLARPTRWMLPCRRYGINAPGHLFTRRLTRQQAHKSTIGSCWVSDFLSMSGCPNQLMADPKQMCLANIILNATQSSPVTCVGYRIARQASLCRLDFGTLSVEVQSREFPMLVGYEGVRPPNRRSPDVLPARGSRGAPALSCPVEERDRRDALTDCSRPCHMLKIWNIIIWISYRAALLIACTILASPDPDHPPANKQEKTGS
jgi:hypothetical protein